MVFDEGLQWMLEKLVDVWQNVPVTENIFLELDTGEREFRKGDTLADMRIPAFPGYTPIRLDSWFDPIITPNFVWTPELTRTFKCTGNVSPVSCVNWFVRTAGDVLLFGTRLPLTVAVEHDGDEVSVLPTLIGLDAGNG